MSVRILCAALALAVSACSSVTQRPTPPSSPSTSCEPGDEAMVRDTLYFGRNIPGGGVVADAQWQAFLDEAVTPRFPDGLTVVAATGQWRGADGQVETEAAQVLTVLHPGDATSRDKVAAIVSEYKRRFTQEAVLRERVAACAAF